MSTDIAEPTIAAKASVTSTELLKLDPETYATAVYQQFREQLDAIKVEAAAVKYDIATVAGLKVATVWRAKFRDLRVSAEKARKERKAPILEIGKLLDSKAKALEAEIVPFEDRFDADIKAQELVKENERKAREAAELARITALQDKVAAIGKSVDRVLGKTSAEIDAAWHEIDAITIDVETFAEFAGQAQMAKTEAMSRLDDLHDKAVAAEAEATRVKAEREELARLRQEQEERDRAATAARAEQERQDKARRDEEERTAKAGRDAEQARLDAQRREQEARQAELDRKEREQQERADKAAQEQRDREAAEQRRVQAEKDAEARRAREAQAESERQEREAAEAEARKQAQIKAARRPSDDQLINVVQHFALGVLREMPSDDEVIEWLASFDAEDARARRLAKAA